MHASIPHSSLPDQPPALCPTTYRDLRRAVIERFARQYGTETDDPVNHHHAQRVHADYAAGHLYLSVRPVRALGFDELSPMQQHDWFTRADFIRDLSPREFAAVQAYITAARATVRGGQ